MRYAGQRLTTGTQGECYAIDVIGLHVKSVAGGKAYADLGGASGLSRRSWPPLRRPTTPPWPISRSSTPASRHSETPSSRVRRSRGLLLTSFGFSVLGAEAGQAAPVAYMAAGLLVLLSLVSLALMHRAPATARPTSPESVLVVTGHQQVAGA